ncbi:MAG: phage tail protein [Anaerolineales bacterium]
MSDRAQAHAAFRFVVQIEGIETATFTECTLPPLEVDLHEEKEGGFNTGTHVFPGRVKRGSVVLKRGLASGSGLLEWYMDVLQGKVAESRRQVSISLYDSRNEEVMRWDFIGAYPHKWSGPTLDTTSEKVAIETLELSFERVMVS